MCVAQQAKCNCPHATRLKLRAVYLRLSLCLALSVCHLLVPISCLALGSLSCSPLSLGILQRAQQDTLTSDLLASCTLHGLA